MASYAVVWQEERSDRVYRGSADFDGHGFVLHGQSAAEEGRRSICDGDLSEVARQRDVRIGPCEAIRVQTHQGLSLLLAAPFGVGVLTELFENLALRVVTAA